MVNNIQLTQNLTCVLRGQRACNSMIKFSKYIVMFILLSKTIVLGYNQYIYTLSFGGMFCEFLITCTLYLFYSFDLS